MHTYHKSAAVTCAACCSVCCRENASGRVAAGCVRSRPPLQCMHGRRPAPTSNLNTAPNRRMPDIHRIRTRATTHHTRAPTSHKHPQPRALTQNDPAARCRSQASRRAPPPPTPRPQPTPPSAADPTASPTFLQSSPVGVCATAAAVSSCEMQVISRRGRVGKQASAGAGAPPRK